MYRVNVKVIIIIIIIIIFNLKTNLRKKYKYNTGKPAYGRQTVPDWGVVRSCDPLQNFGAPYHWNG